MIDINCKKQCLLFLFFQSHPIDRNLDNREGMDTYKMHVNKGQIDLIGCKVLIHMENKKVNQDM